jgi:DNA/RNA endonuclease YhcR with UshA esterase domain
MRKKHRSVLQLAGLFLFLSSLFVFQLNAKNRDTPDIQIGDIRPWMNFRYVQVEGELVQNARLLRAGGVLLPLDDGTGLLPVFLRTGSGMELPEAGSRIRAEGFLGVGAGSDVRLRVADQERVEILEPAGPLPLPDHYRISNNSHEQLGRRVTVCGRIEKLWPPRAGSGAPYKIILNDGPTALAVVHWLENPPQLKSGDLVLVTGRLQDYDGTLQLRVYKAGDISLYRIPD